MKVVKFTREEVIDMLAEHLSDCIQFEIHQSGNDALKALFRRGEPSLESQSDAELESKINNHHKIFQYLRWEDDKPEILHEYIDKGVPKRGKFVVRIEG